MFTKPTIVEGEIVDSYVESRCKHGLTSILQHSIIRDLKYMVHLPLTRLSSANLHPDYDYDARNTIISRPNL